MSKLQSTHVGPQPSYIAPIVTTSDHQAGASSRKLQIVLPANNPDVNLCKTLATITALGYSTPSIVGWQQTFNHSEMMSEGSHLGKITNTLNYLEALEPQNDTDLVLVMDAYDIWFQLPPSILIERYERLVQEGTARAAQRVGSDAAGLKQTIIFAAGKRCAPNQSHTIACYAAPDAPIAKDLYGVNTDTVIGRNKYYSGRQRFLNSGYVIGPAADMRRLFRRASVLIAEHEDNDPTDNGSHGSDSLYHGSDQSIFNIIFGQQEYARETLRRRRMGFAQRTWRALSGTERLARAGAVLEGTPVDDVLNPSFTHETMFIEADKEFEYEYGVGLDYTSDLGHQTVNSERDAEWLHHDRLLEPQVQDRNRFDCPLRAKQQLPEDLATGQQPRQLQVYDGDDALNSGWAGVPLYTHLCYGTIPVMIHHNGLKDARERVWDRLWFQTDAMRSLGPADTSHSTVAGTPVDSHYLALAHGGRGGVWTDTRGPMSWEELCAIGE